LVLDGLPERFGSPTPKTSPKHKRNVTRSAA
jgi:hypothetical protein